MVTKRPTATCKSLMSRREVVSVIQTAMTIQSADVLNRAMFKDRQVMMWQARRVFLPRQWRRMRCM